MKKLFISLAVALFTVSAFAQLDSATVTTVITNGTMAANSTNVSGVFSAGPVYSGTNVAAVNTSIPAVGKVLFVFRGIAATTNAMAVQLQDSPDNSTYTTRATLTLTTAAPGTILTNLNALAKYWRTRVVTTNANSGDSTVSGELIWINRIR